MLPPTILQYSAEIFQQIKSVMLAVFKDFMFWGLTIPDSAKQGYVSDLFLHKKLETCRKLTLDFVYLDGKLDYVTCSNCLQIERIPF